MGLGDFLTFLGYGTTFHRQRKILQDPLTRSRCEAFRDIQNERVRVFLRQLLTEPDDFVSHVRW